MIPSNGAHSLTEIGVHVAADLVAQLASTVNSGNHKVIIGAGPTSDLSSKDSLVVELLCLLIPQIQLCLMRDNGFEVRR